MKLLRLSLFVFSMIHVVLYQASPFVFLWLAVNGVASWLIYKFD